jgi:hypothetical protein
LQRTWSSLTLGTRPLNGKIVGQTKMTAPEPSRQIVQQRVRNRIIEYLELAGALDEQRQYQEAAQISVPVEVINQWEDWVPDPRDPFFSVPVFSTDEQSAIARFQDEWERVTAVLPDPLPDLDEIRRTPAWEHLRGAAIECLEAFLPRGRFPEEEEVAFQ